MLGKQLPDVSDKEDHASSPRRRSSGRWHRQDTISPSGSPQTASPLNSKAHASGELDDLAPLSAGYADGYADGLAARASQGEHSADIQAAASAPDSLRSSSSNSRHNATGSHANGVEEERARRASQETSSILSEDAPRRSSIGSRRFVSLSPDREQFFRVSPPGERRPSIGTKPSWDSPGRRSSVGARPASMGPDQPRTSMSHGTYMADLSPERLSR